MSSLPGLNLEDFVAWSYSLTVDGEAENNISLGMVEALGLSTCKRPVVTREKFKELIAYFEPVRSEIERLLEDFDEDNQSWRDYAQRFDSYIPESVTRRATAWMVSNGFWKKEVMPVIDLPCEYPLLITGAVNTSKSSIALMIAYQEALKNYYGSTEITIVSHEIETADIFNILNKLAPVPVCGLEKFCKQRGIVVKAVRSFDIRAEYTAKQRIIIIDEPEVTFGAAGVKEVACNRECLFETVKALTAVGVKVIVAASATKGLASGFSDSPDGPMKWIVHDFGLLDLIKSFVVTSDVFEGLPISTPTSVTYLDSIQREKEPASIEKTESFAPHRGDNNELKAMPGFFYCPPDTTDLVELDITDRILIVARGQGNYEFSLININDEFQLSDALCYLDNNNIPTHRRKDVQLPTTGTVPLNLFTSY